jgi:hypothetical protein
VWSSGFPLHNTVVTLRELPHHEVVYTAGSWGGGCHGTVFSNAGSDRPDDQCQDAGEKAIPENAVFTEAYGGRQERDEESTCPD